MQTLIGIFSSLALIACTAAPGIAGAPGATGATGVAGRPGVDGLRGPAGGGLYLSRADSYCVQSIQDFHVADGGVQDGFVQSVAVCDDDRDLPLSGSCAGPLGNDLGLFESSPLWQPGRHAGWGCVWSFNPGAPQRDIANVQTVICCIKNR